MFLCMHDVLLSVPLLDFCIVIICSVQHYDILLLGVETKTHTIPQNVTSYNLDNIFMSAAPKRLIVGFVNNDAYNGKYESNPFYFETMNVNKLQLQVGSKSIPSTPLTPDYDNNLHIHCYQSLFSGTGIFTKILEMLFPDLIMPRDLHCMHFS